MRTDTAAALVRSGTRLAILDHLREGDASRYDLRAALDCARTTVDRNVEQLVDEGWAAETETGYTLTTSGAVALEAAETYVETIEAADHLQPILDWLPRDALDIDLRYLADADVVVATDATPVAMVDRHVQAATRAEHARMVLPIVSTQGMDAQAREMTDREVHSEVIVTPTVAEAFTTDPEFEQRLATLRERGDFEAFVTEEPVPYYLGVLDETVQIGVDDDGQPKALLESEDERVRAWAVQKVESIKENATPLSAWR